MRRRPPSKVDRFLSKHPRYRARVLEVARDPGRSGEELLALLRNLGANVSRSGVFKWRSRFPFDQSLRLQAIRLVTEATDEQIRRIIPLLASNRQEIMANPWPMAAPKQRGGERRNRT